MNAEQLRAAFRNAEDLVAFFARAAVLRHCASIARDAGSIGEAARLMRLANESERKVATVVQRMLEPRVAPPASTSAKPGP